MTSSDNYFRTTEHADFYKKFRRGTPQKCIEKAIAFLAEKIDPKECIAIDIGCGSGQSSFPLSAYVKKVIGVDASEAQLAQGRMDPMNVNGVEFRLGTAEHIPVEDHSVHLIFGMHAAHWFDFEAFKKEVDRVLAPNGVLALCSSDRKAIVVLGFEDEYNQFFDQLIEETKSCWNEIALQWSKFYEDAVLPYRCCIRDHSVEEEYEISVFNQIGLLKTMSGVAKYIEQDPVRGELLMNEAQQKLMKMTKSSKAPEDTILKFKKGYILLLARKPQI